MSDFLIVLYAIDTDGTFHHSQLDPIPLESLGGTIPAVGDIIVDPETFHEHVTGKVWQVVKRYFYPTSPAPHVKLVAQQRTRSVLETHMGGQDPGKQRT